MQCSARGNCLLHGVPSSYPPFTCAPRSCVLCRLRPHTCLAPTIMRWHRPKVFHDPDCLLRTFSPTVCRMVVCVSLMAAALVVDCAAISGAPTYAEGVRQQAVGAAGFIAPAGPPAGSWPPFRREGGQRRLVGDLGARTGCGRGTRRRCVAAPTSAFLWALREEAEEEHTGRQRNVARLLRLREHDCSSTRRVSSSPSLLLLRAGAVELDVNATVGGETSPGAAPVAAAAAAAPPPVALPVDGTKKERKPKQPSSTKESTSIEGKEATVIVTEAGGRPHTVASKAKISAANKGKKPWNVGVGHSEETRRKIAEGARNAARKRKQKTAESLVRGRRRFQRPLPIFCLGRVEVVVDRVGSSWWCHGHANVSVAVRVCGYEPRDARMLCARLLLFGHCFWCLSLCSRLCRLICFLRDFDRASACSGLGLITYTGIS